MREFSIKHLQHKSVGGNNGNYSETAWGAPNKVLQGSNLVLLLFNLLLDRQCCGLLYGELCSHGHQTVVGIHYVSSDLI